MSALHSIADRIELLRSRSQRYKQLAAVLTDRRAAAEVSVYADELEAEIIRLEGCEGSHRGLDTGRPAFAP